MSKYKTREVMKVCNYYKNKLPDYLSGTLSEKESADIASHLASCQSCMKEAARIEKIANAFLEPEDVPVNPFLYTRIESRLMRPKTTEKNMARRLLQPLAYVTVLFLGIYLGIQLGTNVQNNNETSYADAYAETQYFNEMKLDPISTTILKADTEDDVTKNEQDDENEQ